jgi:membrane protease YdiL (CAAX protease family)
MDTDAGRAGYGLGVQFDDIQIDLIWPALITQLLFVAPAEEIAFRFIAPRYISERFPKRSKTVQMVAVLVIAQGSFAAFHMGAYQGSLGSLFIAWTMGCLWYLASIWRPFGKEPLGIGFTVGSHAAYNLTVIGVLAGASHWITIG